MRLRARCRHARRGFESGAFTVHRFGAGRRARVHIKSAVRRRGPVRFKRAGLQRVFHFIWSRHRFRRSAGRRHYFCRSTFIDEVRCLRRRIHKTPLVKEASVSEARGLILGARRRRGLPEAPLYEAAHDLWHGRRGCRLHSITSGAERVYYPSSLRHGTDVAFRDGLRAERPRKT